MAIYQCNTTINEALEKQVRYLMSRGFNRPAIIKAGVEALITQISDVSAASEGFPNELIAVAKEILKQNPQLSITELQHKLTLGYVAASRLYGLIKEQEKEIKP